MKHFLFLLLTVILSSCDEDKNLSDYENGIINGVVIDKTTGEVISDATVFLKGYEITGDIINPGPTFDVATTTSDINGKFFFDFNYEDKNGYFCSGYSEMYWDLQEEFDIDGEIYNGNVNAQVSLQPKAWMSVHIKNVNTYEPSDYISISDIGIFYGNEVDTSIIDLVLGNYSNLIVWGVVLNGIPPSENDSDNVYCPSFDTTYYEILY